MKTARIENVATNIISGFLGVGKTSAVLSLFEQKPKSEKWAVLVNEYGDTGIDGSIYQANGIVVKEIPGGCMCCAQGLPLQVAINRLLKASRPDRLIIESSGVGHPGGVLKTLSGHGFKQALTLKAGICLLDPENLLDQNMMQNDLFQQQLDYADVLVANKTDIASITALQHFQSFARSFSPDKAHIAETFQGKLMLDWLDLPHQQRQAKQWLHSSDISDLHWQTQSWHFPATTCFSLQALKDWISGLDVTRLKAILKTRQGYFLFNYISGQLSYHPVADGTGSQLQIISQHIDIESIEIALNNCKLA